MSGLIPGGAKKNHKKGIAAARKAQKRAEAEARQAAHIAKPWSDKFKVAGKSERARLLEKAEQVIKGKA